VSIDQAIDAFWQCARQRTAPGPEWMKRLSREEAYRVQLGVLARYVAAGERQAGWKVGLTSKAMQAQQGVHEPVLGFLLQSGEQPSGTRFRYADLIRPGFENELCLTVGTTLRGPGVTTERAAAALVEGLRNGSLRPVIAQELPLAQAARSHEAVMEAGHHGKVVLIP